MATPDQKIRHTASTADAAALERALMDANLSGRSFRPLEHQSKLLQTLIESLRDPDAAGVRDLWGIGAQAFGKTIVYAYFFDALLRAGHADSAGRFGVWSQPDNRLIAQAILRISEHTPDLLDRTVVYTTSSRFRSLLEVKVPSAIDRVTIAYPDSSQSLKNLEGRLLLTSSGLLVKLLNPQERRHPTLAPDPQTIFGGDESHTLLSAKRRETVGRFISAGSLVLNLTATPALADGREVSMLHEGREPFFHFRLRDAVPAGLASSAASTLIVARPKIDSKKLREEVAAAHPELSAEEWTSAYRHALSAAARDARLRAFVEDWGTGVNPVTGAPLRDSKTMAFFHDKRTADDAAALLNETYGAEYGRPPAIVLHSDLSHAAQVRALRSFARGSYKVLCSVGMVKHGHDDPEVGTVYVPGSTSDVFLSQAIGRAVRVNPENPCKVASLRQIISLPVDRATVLLPEAVGSFEPVLGAHVIPAKEKKGTQKGAAVVAPAQEFEVISEASALERITYAHVRRRQLSAARLDPAPDGFLNAEQVIDRLRRDGYRLPTTARAAVFEKFESLHTELEAHLDASKDSLDAPYMSTSGIEVRMAGSPKGNRLHAREESILDWAGKEVTSALLRTRPPRAGYIPLSRAADTLEEVGFVCVGAVRTALGDLRYKLCRDLKEKHLQDPDAAKPFHSARYGITAYIEGKPAPGDREDQWKFRVFVKRSDLIDYAESTLGLRKLVGAETAIPSENLNTARRIEPLSESMRRVVAILDQASPLAFRPEVLSGCLEILHREYVTEQMGRVPAERNRGSHVVPTGLMGGIELSAVTHKGAPTLSADISTLGARMAWILGRSTERLTVLHWQSKPEYGDLVERYWKIRELGFVDVEDFEPVRYARDRTRNSLRRELARYWASETAMSSDEIEKVCGSARAVLGAVTAALDRYLTETPSADAPRERFFLYNPRKDSITETHYDQYGQIGRLRIRMGDGVFGDNRADVYVHAEDLFSCLTKSHGPRPRPIGAPLPPPAGFTAEDAVPDLLRTFGFEVNRAPLQNLLNQLRAEGFEGGSRADDDREVFFHSATGDVCVQKSGPFDAPKFAFHTESLLNALQATTIAALDRAVREQGWGRGVIDTSPRPWPSKRGTNKSVVHRYLMNVPGAEGDGGIDDAAPIDAT